MERSSEFATGQGDGPKYVTRGNGAAIHLATEVNGSIVSLCDRWSAGNAMGGRQKGRVRQVHAEGATCQRCLKSKGKGA